MGTTACGSSAAADTGAAGAWEEALARSLRADVRALDVIIDSTDVQVRGATLVMNWIEAEAIAGSDQLLRILMSLGGPVPFAAERGTYETLVATAGLEAVGDPELRAALATHYRTTGELEEASQTRWPEVTTLLDSTLSPGVWRHLHDIPAGDLAIDFRRDLSQLVDAGLVGQARAALRHSRLFHSRLVAVRAEAHALSERLARPSDPRATAQ